MSQDQPLGGDKTRPNDVNTCGVSILVLVERPFGPVVVFVLPYHREVSILVLVERPFGRPGMGLSTQVSCVSILVLVERPFGHPMVD